MAVKGSQVNIPCHAIGSPEPVIEWFVGDDRRPLQSNAKYHIAGNGTLQIKNIGEQDATTYKCTAENLVGKIERDTSVELACKSNFSSVKYYKFFVEYVIMVKDHGNTNVEYV